MADLDLSLHSGTFTGDINVFLNNNVANKNDSWEGQSAHGVNNLIVGSGTFTLTQDLGNSNDLGDITIAEQGSTIGFAGKRVIQDTIREELPIDFQKAEYLKDHGMVDIVCHRKDLKNILVNILNHIN